VLLNSTELALIHGCTAQAFFGLMVVLCVVTGRGWTEAAPLRPDPCHLRRRSAVTLFLIATQIVLGAWLRHYGDGRALLVHAVFGGAVFGHVVPLALRVLRQREAATALRPAAWAMLALTVLQVCVGVAAWWLLRPFDGIARPVWPAQAAVRIAHQGLGALLFAAAIVGTMRAFGTLGTARSPVRHRLEAVA
jgi:cytochrome c oxidase assembly protein subunit 15